MSAVIETTCKDANEFMAHMRLDHMLWRQQSSNWWAFRGQADSRWPLTPKAFRPSTNFAYKGDAVNPPLGVEEQRKNELKALNHFLFLADRVGLPVPGDGQHLRLPDTVQSSPPSMDQWPWPNVLEVLAIAQHHGVPTRLVDFTHNPLIAAFFAAYSAWQHDLQLTDDDEHPDSLAVWAVNLNAISAAVEKHRDRHERPSVIWVTASRAGNTYLHQQDALFLLDLNADNRYPRPPELEEAIMEAPSLAKLAPPPYPQIVKVLLPRQCAAEVLRLLWNEFYHPARLMPTYDNVVATMEYRRKLGI